MIGLTNRLSVKRKCAWRAAFALVALMVLPVAPASASASCWTAKPSLPEIDSSAALQQRYDVLRARQNWTFAGELVPHWRQLLDDIKRDPVAPPELLALGYANVANALVDNASFHQRLELARTAEAIVLANGLGDRPSHVGILTTLAFKEIAEVKLEDAARHAEAAVAAAKRHFGENSWEYGWALTAAGSAAVSQGRYEESLADQIAAEAIAIRCLPADSPRIPDRISAHAVLLTFTGRTDEALATHFRAANWVLAHTPSERSAGIYALFNLGASLRNAMRLGESEAVLRRAIKLALQYAPNAYGIRSQAMAKLAEVLDREGRNDEAEMRWIEAQKLDALNAEHVNPTAGGNAMSAAAVSAERRGDMKLALARHVEALRLLGSVAATHPDVASAQMRYASTLAHAGRTAEAMAHAEPALAIIRAKMKASDALRMAAEIDYARIVASASGAEAGYAVAAAVEPRLEAVVLDGTMARGDLVNYAPVFASTFGEFAGLALATGRKEDAFRALQFANLSQIVLVTTAMAGRVAVNDPEARAFVIALQDDVRKRRVLDRQRSLALSSDRKADAVAIQQQLDAADPEIKRRATELDVRFPQLRQLGRPTPVTLAEFSARLGPDDILIAPLTVRDGTLAIAVTHDGLVWQKTDADPATVEMLARRVRSAVDTARTSPKSQPFDVAAARSLYNAIVPATLQAPLARHRSLRYYASGTLAAIPPALLVESSGRAAHTAWLVRSHDITVLPTLAPSPPRLATVEHPRRFLGIGAPLLNGQAVEIASRGFIFRDASIDTGALASLPSLASAADELEQMRRVVGSEKDVVLTGAGATKAAFEALPLDRFSVIAFATHGLVGGDFPGLSEPALVLSPALGNDGDAALLTASEIAGLKLDADWVILSACNTASGGSAGSSEYAGLASAFVQAGARALLVSHWPVRDDAAARLTVDTLSGAARGESRALALQRAMVRLMDDRSVPDASNPAVWAPFVLVGQ